MKKIFLFVTLMAVVCSVKSQTLEQSIGGLHTTSKFMSVRYDASDSSTIHAGYIYDSTNANGRDWFMVKLDKNQNIVWQKVIQNTGDDFIYKVIVCANGDYVAVGEFSANGIHRGLVCRMNSATGNIKWSRITANTSIGEILYDVVETKNKNLAISGSDQWGSGTANSLIMLLSAGGKTKWSKISNYSNTDEPFTINQLPNGNLITGVAKWMGHHNLVIVELDELTGKIKSETSHSIDTTLTSSGQYVNSVWPWGINIVKGEVTVYAQTFYGCCGHSSMCVYRYDTITKKLSGNIYYHSDNVNATAFAYVPLAKNDYLIAQSFSSPNKVFVSRIRNGKVIYDNLLNDSVNSIDAVDTTGVNAVWSGTATVAGRANAFNLFASRSNFASSCGITSSKTLIMQPSVLPATTINDISLVVGGTMEDVALSPRAGGYTLNNICGKCSSADNLRTVHITSSAATLRWDAASDPDSWQVQYKPVNSDVWTRVILDGSSRVLRLSNLASGKKYQWRIRSKCYIEWTNFSEDEFFTTLSSAFQNAVAESLSVVSVQPNPSPGAFTVQYNSDASGKVILRIYNQLGKEIFNQSVSAIKGNNTYSISLPAVAAGLYHLELTGSQGKQRIKLLIEK